MDTLKQYGPQLLDGYLVTLKVTGLALLVTMAAAVVLGTARTARLRSVRAAAEAIVEFLRGTSSIVQLFWVFYALPIVTGVQIEPLVAAVAVLGLNGGAYGAEIVRGAIKAVPAGQREASIALGLTSFHTLRRIILPQAIARMLPSFGTLSIEIMKGTAFVGFVQVADLFFWTDQARVATSDPLPIYMFVLIAYFVTSLAIAAIFWLLERNTVLRRAERVRPHRARRANASAGAPSTRGES
ncbi:MAG: polar amino acid transport system permease protein [Solirubrobacteraceae bacterium]